MRSDVCASGMLSAVALYAASAATATESFMAIKQAEPCTLTKIKRHLYIIHPLWGIVSMRQVRSPDTYRTVWSATLCYTSHLGMVVYGANRQVERRDFCRCCRFREDSHVAQ